MGIFRRAAMRQQLKQQLRYAQIEYAEAIAELDYRRSKLGARLHDEQSIQEQLQVARALRDAIEEDFGLSLVVPE